MKPAKSALRFLPINSCQLFKGLGAHLSELNLTTYVHAVRRVDASNEPAPVEVPTTEDIVEEACAYCDPVLHGLNFHCLGLLGLLSRKRIPLFGFLYRRPAG
jgi:hypothetical protein